MPDIRIDGLEEALATLEGVAERMRDLGPVLRVAAEDTKTFIDDRFDTGTSPAGEAWPALSPATAAIRASLAVQMARFGVASRSDGEVSVRALDKARKRALKAMEEREKARKPLVDTARLRNSVSVRGEKDSLVFGTNVIYGGTHQFGREDNKVFGKYPAPIPARPFLPITGTRKTPLLDRRGPSGKHWDEVIEMVREYVITGRIKG